MTTIANTAIDKPPTILGNEIDIWITDPYAIYAKDATVKATG